MKLVIASKNPDKINELSSLLAGLPVEVLPLSRFPNAPDIREDGSTFEANATKKAVGIARFTGLYAVADDSGLCVDALGGRPGIYSARYAGRGATPMDMCKKVLKEIRMVSGRERTAHFKCSIVMAAANGSVKIEAEGACHGTIARRMRGGRGFGYDPIFLYPPAGKTFAQMEADEKHKHSHRGAAMKEFRAKLEAYLQ